MATQTGTVLMWLNTAKINDHALHGAIIQMSKDSIYWLPQRDELWK